MALTAQLLGSTNTTAAFTLDGVVAGTEQSISYADLAAAVNPFGPEINPASVIYHALTASYPDRNAALGAMIAAAAPGTLSALVLGATGVTINAPTGASVTIGLEAYVTPALVVAGAQSARFTAPSLLVPLASPGGELGFTVLLRDIVALLPRSSPVKDALSQLAACTTMAETRAALRDTQLSNPIGSMLFPAAIYPSVFSPNPVVLDSIGLPIVAVNLVALDGDGRSANAYEAADFTFTVPHSIIK
jgi:hypothetical protein